MTRRLILFIQELVLYAGTVAIGIVVAARSISGDVVSVFEPVEITPENLLIFALVFIVFTTVVVRFVRFGSASLRLAMYLAIFVGVQFVFSAFTPMPWNLLAGVSAVLVLRYAHVLWVHNLAIVIGIAGISALLGLGMTPLIAVVLLAVLSIYDIIAVYRTKHMVAVAQRMMNSGAVFGFLVPVSLRDLTISCRDALDSNRVMMLGSGDVGLPLVLAVSSVSTSVNAAVVVGVFSLLGLGITHWLFMAQRERKPMAALPPVAAMAIVGYLVAILVGF